ncbi:MAG: hypothetical protein LW685_08195 [Algoriphagus sp.]|nr:hypothetical protein [Algoriphagus sp.]
MKKVIFIALVLFYAYSHGYAQKLDSILSKSSLSFSYGLSHDFFACCVDTNDKLPIVSFNNRSDLVNFDDYRIRGTKNFHYLLYKRHFIEEKLIGAAGIYNLRYRDPYVEIIGNSDQTIVTLSDEVVVIDFGIFAGLEYYHALRKNFQVGLRTRLFYTQGYDESFESFELTPVLRFRL